MKKFVYTKDNYIIIDNINDIIDNINVQYLIYIRI